tara:strand:- start:786 stop:1949 length:1164 start_codon:yes stop_codon:yes gene_type:complete
MSYFKFEEDDLFVNTIEAYPQYKFYIHSGSIYINDMPHIPGANQTNIIGVPKGFISLYEYNIDRPTNQNIYPFIIKDATRQTFKRGSSTDYGSQVAYGERITSSYNMSSSIDRQYFSGTSRRKILALKNVLRHYTVNSHHYQFKSEGEWDKATQKINLISIPSIFYGSSIKQGSMKLKYYVSGALVGELRDVNRNGELIQIGPYGSTGSGSVAGCVLYKEGFVLLTGSWSLNTTQIQTDDNGPSKWLHYGYGANDGNTIASSSVSASFSLEYSGSTHTQTMTMFAHAKYENLNWSNNPTYVTMSTATPYCVHAVATGSYFYQEQSNEIKNIVYSQFSDEKPKFKKTVYISKIGLYDKDKNLIGVAKVATPVRKTEDHQYTFKLKLDI